MRRIHTMPFGAELHAASARFRLCAPSAYEVSVHLEGPVPDAVLPMHALRRLF